MTDLTPITALGATAPAQLRAGALTITENAGLALASLSLRAGQPQPMPFGLTLPGPGAWVAGDDLAAFWTAPGQWMIESEGRAESGFAAALAAEAPGCAITEQTDGWTAFEIDGPPEAIRALLEKLVNIDAAGLTPGHATRTGLHHMGAFLIRRAGDRLAVIGMRSLAAALWHALTETAKRQGETA